MIVNKIFGVGVDIESIDRFSKSEVVDNKLFLNKVFTTCEQDYCFSNGLVASHLAVRFAGKEAVIKALSVFGEVNIGYRDIEILNGDNGVPFVNINNKNFEKLMVNISLSHCDDKVVAFVIVTN